MPNVRSGATAERRKLAARAAALRRDGLIHREIAERLGISRAYAGELLNDPSGSKTRARKDSYSQPCPTCGQPMTGSDGRGNAPRRCQACAWEQGPANKVWTEASIIAAFQHFAKAIGRPPAVVDVVTRYASVARKYSRERLAEAERSRRLAPLPLPATVCGVFGSWAAALDAAGLERNRSGAAGHRVRARRKRVLG